MNMLNTHTYDYNLPQLNFSPENYQVKSIEIYNKLRDELSKKLNTSSQIALIFFDYIVNAGHTSPNFDHTNNIYADDLLYMIAIQIDMIPWDYFIEQLLDMASGFCPQGRVARLLQIVNCIYN